MLPFFLGHKARIMANEMNIPLTAGFHCQAENLTTHFFMMDAKLANHMVYKVFYSVLYKYCDAIHYPTEFIKDVFEAEIQQKTNAYIISNGVRKIFKLSPCEKPDYINDKFVILFSGRISKEKNQKVLIDAAAKSKYKDRIHLVFAGSGPMEIQMKEYARQVLTNKPDFGFRKQDELVKIINYSDLYVHPAKVEIEAISCLEAISCGLVPVISDSSRSATRYFALGEHNLFKNDDADDLVAKIDYWIENPEKKKECAGAYLNYTKIFDQDYCMDKMEEMLKDAINLHKGKID
jgi:glycosyltransferase involved in cell wall biosynthesis